MRTKGLRWCRGLSATVRQAAGHGCQWCTCREDSIYSREFAWEGQARGTAGAAPANTCTSLAPFIPHTPSLLSQILPLSHLFPRGVGRVESRHQGARHGGHVVVGLLG